VPSRLLPPWVETEIAVAPASSARLSGYFDDPAAGAAAPRVLSLDPARGPVATYEARRSSVDMGPRRGRVRPWSPVPYRPSATLIVRRDAIGPGFDEALNIGEDVDLVWRIGDAGWGVWYDPSVAVHHEHRSSLRAFASRRFTYATSIGALAARHPAALAALRADTAT
jgi:GT2 family glycosyltransferase